MNIDGNPLQVIARLLHEDGRIEKVYSENFDTLNPNTAHYFYNEIDGVFVHTYSIYCPYIPKFIQGK